MATCWTDMRNLEYIVEIRTFDMVDLTFIGHVTSSILWYFESPSWGSLLTLLLVSGYLARLDLFTYGNRSIRSNLSKKVKVQISHGYTKMAISPSSWIRFRLNSPKVQVKDGSWLPTNCSSIPLYVYPVAWFKKRVLKKTVFRKIQKLFFRKLYIG